MNNYHEFVKSLTKPMGGDKLDFAHAAMGMASEAGEAADCIKAHVIYNRELDVINLVEECGDQLFYIEMALQKLDLTIEDAMFVNVAKLSCRYKEGYSDAAANHRKKQFEREAMQQALETIRGGEPHDDVP